MSSALTLTLHWVCPIIALTYIIGYSLIFEPVRRWKRLPSPLAALLDCPMCIGFWVGVGVGIINWLPVSWPAWLQYAAIGACLAVTCEYLIEVFAREKE